MPKEKIPKNRAVNVSRRKLSAGVLLSAGLIGSTGLVGGCSATGPRARVSSTSTTKTSTRKASTTSAKTAQNRGYDLIDNPISTPLGNAIADDNKVDVSLLISYQCPPCFDTERLLTPWATKNSSVVNYSKEMPPLSDAWERDARLYYALFQMQRSEQFIEEVYSRAETGTRWMSSNIEIAKTVKSMDSSIDEGELLDVMNSNEVEAKLERAQSLANQSGTRLIPTIIVNGKYRVDPATAGGFKNIVRVIDGLVKYEIEQG